MLKFLFLRVLLIVALSLLFGTVDSRGQANPATKEEAPLRVALAGLVHGHASGFFDQFQHRTDLQIVGIAEADRQLAAQFAKSYGLAPSLFYSDLEEMLKATQPQAVLAYTNTYDHRRVVEICAVWRARDDGKAAGGEPRRCTGDRESGARGENSGFGELRDDVVPQQSGGLRSGA